MSTKVDYNQFESNIRSLIDQALKIRNDDGTLNTFDKIFDHYVKENYVYGHDQKSTTIIQEILDDVINNKIDEYDLVLNNHAPFICNDDNKYAKLYGNFNWQILNNGIK